MKKFINGRIVEMTETEIAKNKERFKNRGLSNRNKSITSTVDTEERIKNLENIIAELVAKIEILEHPVEDSNKNIEEVTETATE